MIPAKRQQIILSTLAEHEVVSITELTALLGVSHMTIRRDIQKLEQEGRVLSISGGVKLTEMITAELSYAVKRSLEFAEKSAIAQYASSFIRPGISIYLDVGTTSLALAKLIAEVPNLTIISNDLSVVNYLVQYSECHIFHAGGAVLRDNQSCVGESTAQFLKNLNVDISFITASSWNARWVSTPTEAKVSVKKAAIAAATKRILICDASKYGKMGMFNAVALEDIDIVITDSRLPKDAQNAIQQSGVQLIIAN